MSKEHNIKLAFVSDYLSSYDILKDGNKTLIATIERGAVEVRSIAGGKKKPYVIVWFTDKALKPMIVNSGNTKILVKFTGIDEADEWKNVPVEIFVDHNRRNPNGGDPVDGLGFKTRQPNQEKPELTPNMTAWVNVVSFYKKNQSFEQIESQYKISEFNKTLIITQSNA
jgi:hypothetical protein